jgi:hypothetical protein
MQALLAWGERGRAALWCWGPADPPSCSAKGCGRGRRRPLSALNTIRDRPSKQFKRRPLVIKGAPPIYRTFGAVKSRPGEGGGEERSQEQEKEPRALGRPESRQRQGCLYGVFVFFCTGWRGKRWGAAPRASPRGGEGSPCRRRQSTARKRRGKRNEAPRAARQATVSRNGYGLL